MKNTIYEVDEYSKDLKTFGFHDYGIDFSFIPVKDVLALCKWIRKYNKDQARKQRRVENSVMSEK